MDENSKQGERDKISPESGSCRNFGFYPKCYGKPLDRVYPLTWLWALSCLQPGLPTPSSLLDSPWSCFSQFLKQDLPSWQCLCRFFCTLSPNQHNFTLQISFSRSLPWPPDEVRIFCYGLSRQVLFCFSPQRRTHFSMKLYPLFCDYLH